MAAAPLCHVHHQDQLTVVTTEVQMQVLEEKRMEVNVVEHTHTQHTNTH
jgi:hypothetical protein